MITYYFNLGSNTGDSRGVIGRAVGILKEWFGSVRLSSYVESEPWGFDSANPFLNLGAAVVSDLEPLEMLHRIQGLEKQLGSGPHRNPDGSYRDRLIDIDIMAAERNGQSIRMATPVLTLPHLHLHSRPFFLTPLGELTSTDFRQTPYHKNR